MWTRSCRSSSSSSSFSLVVSRLVTTTSGASSKCVYSSKPSLHPRGRAGLRAPNPANNCACCAALAPLRGRRPRHLLVPHLPRRLQHLDAVSDGGDSQTRQVRLAERSKRRGVHPVRAKLRAEMRESIPTERLHDGFVVPDAFGHLLREVLRGFPLRDEREGEGVSPAEGERRGRGSACGSGERGRRVP